MKRVVVLTGAGMSVESGFSTFRGSGGMWDNYKVEEVASHDGWLANPVLVNNFYNRLRRQLLAASPNKGHRLLAEMEREYDMRIVTQNVDDLHERAGSSHVLHLHGELMKVTSSRNPDDIRCIREMVSGHEEVMPGEKAVDGSLLRPYIVFFQEPVPNIGVAGRWVGEADIFVIIGTSLNVYPAAGLLDFVRPGVPVYLIDPNPVTVSSGRQVVPIARTASEGIAVLREMLGA